MLYGFALASRSAACSTELDCELSGVCVSGLCVCDAGWSGPACQLLDLLPNTPGHVAFRDTNQSWASWGSSPPILTTDGTYHLYATRDLAGCPVVPDYTFNQQLVHATSPSLLGPYQFKNVALHQVIINPHVIRAPGGELVLFFSGEPVPSKLAKNCSSVGSSTPVGTHARGLKEPPGPKGYLNDGCVLSIATSPDVDTPFVNILTNFTPVGADRLFCRTNPTAFIFANGTTMLYFRSAESDGENEQIWLATAPSYKGPYTLHHNQPVGPSSDSSLIGGLNNEDPFIYRIAPRGRFILMLHMPHWGPGWNGAKAFSYDGITWHWSSESMSRVWNSTISYTDGTAVTFRRREEPKIFVDERGYMRAMFNAVTDPHNNDVSYVMSQAIRGPTSTSTSPTLPTTATDRPTIDPSTVHDRNSTAAAPASPMGGSDELNPRVWYEYNNSNACPGSLSSGPSVTVVKDVAVPRVCADKCKGSSAPGPGTRCNVWSWSPHSKNCYLRNDTRWSLGWPNDGYHSGCLESTVWNCGYQPATASCPSHFLPPASAPAPPPPPPGPLVHKVTASVGPTAVHTLNRFRMLGVNFDFWDRSKPMWDGCGALNSALEDPKLMALARRLNGSLLRMGGSPADFLLYDVFDGACSPARLNATGQKTRSGYFCPIWDQSRGQCLTMLRWQQINTFALRTGLHILFDLNACWGRENASAPMDMSMISGLFDATALMARASQSAVYGFGFGNELYSNVGGARYGTDILALGKMLQATWATHAPSALVPVLVGPDNGWEDMSASHLDEILNITGGTMVGSSFHDYQNECFDGYTGTELLANTSCFSDHVAELKARFDPVVGRHHNQLWCTECGPHSNSGVDGLTNTWSSSMWYADALGLYAANGIGMLSRQTLLGGDYEIINRTTGLPNPDFYPAVLWHDLIGAEVYGVTLHGCDDPDCRSAVRLYAHSGLQDSSSTVLVALNFATSAASGLTIRLTGVRNGTGAAAAGSGSGSCELWQIRGAKGATLREISVNGAPADLSLQAVPCPSPLVLPPTSVSFIRLS